MATDDGKVSEEVVVATRKRLKLGHEDEAEPVKNAGVTTLNLSHDETLTNIEFIKHFPCLTHLDLSSCHKLTSIRDVCLLTTLKHLNLTANKKIADLEELGKLVNLRTLNLSLVFNRDDVPYPRTFDFLRPLILLRKLDISGNDWIFSVKALSSLSGLTSLDISYCPSIQDFESLVRFPTLKRLKMGLPHIVRHSLDLSFLKEMTILESLYVNRQTKLPDLPDRVRIQIEKEIYSATS